MARPLRLEFEGAFYHVTARGNERKNIYWGRKDYQKFLEYLREAEKKYGIIVHGYVLMTNHYHLLLETPEPNLSQAMHHINGAYTNYINIKKKRYGHLFQGRYKSLLVDKDSYLIELSRYIHLNPVRAGMVQRPEDYSYSSYPAYISTKTDDVVSRDLLLGMMAANKKEAQKKYRNYVEAGIVADIESPFDKVYGGMILGGERFIKETLKRIKQEYLSKGEVSHRRALRTSYDMEDILKCSAETYRVSTEDVLEGRLPEAKKAAIYLIKKHMGVSNQEIGDRFGGLSYSAAAKICRRLEQAMEGDRSLRKKIGRIERTLSNVKG
jgi:REP-associated tyrosine transposase